MQQPDEVKQTLEKVGTGGLVPMVEAIRSKLGELNPLGYSKVWVGYIPRGR